jgi:uncharacterized membrane protein YgdD (TMEM256/DUF423 family)
MQRKILIQGLIIAMLSVIFGAFGAHAIKNLVTPDKVSLFETGVRYQFMHAIALIILSQQKGVKWAANFFLLGILFFCGSLYLLTFQSVCSFQYAKIIGPITPIGGLFFILGWASWVRVVLMHKVDK